MDQGPRVAWIVTNSLDSKKNLLCLSVLEALHIKPKIICIEPRWPLTWLPSFLFRFCPPQKSLLLTPPWPDMIMVAHLNVIPYVRYIKAQAEDFCFVCAATDPKAFYQEFDLVLVHEKDKAPRLANVETISNTPVNVAETIAKRLLEHYAIFLQQCDIGAFTAC